MAKEKAEQELTVKIKTLASQNNLQDLLPLLKGTIFYLLAIEEAAKMNHTTLVDKLLAHLGVSFETKQYSDMQLTLLNKALSGYVQGEHFDAVKGMVKRGANIFHGLNVLLARDPVIDIELARNLLSCVDGSQKIKLQEKMERVFDMDLSDEIKPGLTHSLV